MKEASDFRERPDAWCPFLISRLVAQALTGGSRPTLRVGALLVDAHVGGTRSRLSGAGEHVKGWLARSNLFSILKQICKDCGAAATNCPTSRNEDRAAGQF